MQQYYQVGCGRGECTGGGGFFRFRWFIYERMSLCHSVPKKLKDTITVLVEKVHKCLKEELQSHYFWPHPTVTAWGSLCESWASWWPSSRQSYSLNGISDLCSTIFHQSGRGQCSFLTDICISPSELGILWNGGFLTCWCWTGISFGFQSTCFCTFLQLTTPLMGLLARVQSDNATAATCINQ